MYNNMLTSKQKEFYKENGFLKLEGLFDPEELDKLATEYEELFEVKTTFIKLINVANVKEMTLNLSVKILKFIS